jgi:hypothetical protein
MAQKRHDRKQRESPENPPFWSAAIHRRFRVGIGLQGNSLGQHRAIVGRQKAAMNRRVE